MIIEALFALIITIFDIGFAIVPSLPHLPGDITTNLFRIIDLIFENASLLGIFIRLSTIKIAVPLLILVINFDRVFKIFSFAFGKLHK